MISVSVIIPVFNAALHLERCIASLLAQTLGPCEFIFINDGSTDESREIIEKFQKTDSRIVLVNQQNQGVSMARNVGLIAAKGKYIGFVDADDKVDADFFGTLFRIAEENNAEIVMSRYILHQKGRQVISPDFFNYCRILESDYIKNQVIPFMIQTENLNAIWTKIYRKKLLQENQITFPVGVALGEDGLFNLKAFHCAERVYSTDFAGYHYFEIEGSATRDFASKDYFGALVKDYQRDYSAYGNENLDAQKIASLKAEKFLKKAVSLIHEYTDPVYKISIKTAYNKISQIVNNAVFRQVIKDNYHQVAATKNRYEKFILWSARHKWVSLLFIAAAYSRFKNK